MPDAAPKVVFPCPHCGKRYRQPASAAGRTAKCAGCGEPFVLKPAAGAAAKPKRVRKPPATPPPAPVTEENPFDLDAEEPAPAAPRTRSRGGRTGGRSAASSRKTRSKSAGAAAGGAEASRQFWKWVKYGGAALAGTGVLAGLLSIFIPGPLFLWGGAALLVAFVLSTVGGIWLLVQAFQEDVTQGLLTLFVPFYAIYYTATRWAATWRATTLYLLGAAAGIVGMLAMGGGLFALLLGADWEQGGPMTVPGENGGEIQFDMNGGETPFDFGEDFPEGSGFPDGSGFPEAGGMPDFGSGFGMPGDEPAGDPEPRVMTVTFNTFVEGSPERETTLREALAESPVPDAELVVADWPGQGLMIRYTGTKRDEFKLLDAVRAAGVNSYSWNGKVIEAPDLFEAKPQRWELSFLLEEGVTGDDAKTAALREALAEVDLNDVELTEADWPNRRLKVRFTGYQWAGWVISRKLDEAGAKNNGFSYDVVD